MAGNVEAPNCPFCGVKMDHKKLRGNSWWECSECKSEFWPYSEQKEKQIRRAMYSDYIKPKKRGGSSKKKGRYKTKKPGEKWIPWYQR